jgi:hypothetical protein
MPDLEIKLTMDFEGAGFACYHEFVKNNATAVAWQSLPEHTREHWRAVAQAALPYVREAKK